MKSLIPAFPRRAIPAVLGGLVCLLLAGAAGALAAAWLARLVLAGADLVLVCVKSGASAEMGALIAARLAKPAWGPRLLISGVWILRPKSVST